MKLLYSQASPYVRKVLMVAHEAGLADRIEIVPTDVRAADSPVVQSNPLGKIPALLLDDGTALYDSPVIAEYLDSLHDRPALFPPPGPARWTALRQQALADGLCDAALLRRMEGMRPANLQSADWDSHQRRAVNRSLDQLELGLEDLPDSNQPTIGSLAVLAALAYLDFRFAAEPWRVGRSGLSRWFEAAASRDSFRLTQPPSE